MTIEYSIANDELGVALKNMKNHDSNKRIQGIKLFTSIIKADCNILSVDIIQRLQFVFECEHNIEVLLQLSKSCTCLGLISIFEEKICQLDINEFDLFSKGCIINHANQIIYNAYNNCSNEVNSTKSEPDKNSLFAIEKIMSLIPILQDIAELDDVYVRTETLKSLKSLISIITFVIEKYLSINCNYAKYNELELIFNYSLEIFQKLANSDILSHKILSCHIIPLIFEQKRLSEIFVDEKNILLTKYSDFCVHPAPILRKHASKVFNYILEQIEFEEGIIEILLIPMIRNFCCDEQEGVRLIAIENIEAFFSQIIELAQSNNESIKNVFAFFEKLQPFIFILYNDTSWRIRSSVSRPIINIYSRLFHLVTSSGTEKLDNYFKEKSIDMTNKIHRNENINTEDSENKSKNLYLQFKENNASSYYQSKNDSSFSDADYLNKLTLILTQLLLDPEPETRINTLSNILETIEEQIIESKSIIATKTSQISYIFKTLFFDIIIHQINNANTFLSDQYASVRVNFSRIVKIIILIKTSFEIDENMNIELENAFDKLISKLVHDEDDQVRQSVVLALCSVISEPIDVEFFMYKIVLPHSSTVVQDNFWRVRYCNVILLTLTLYKILFSYFNEEEIWSDKINLYQNQVNKDFLNDFKGTIDELIRLIIMNITDKASIIRQLTSIFSMPLLSFWLGTEWTKNQLWNKHILPMMTNEKSYITRITGLLLANSIIIGVSIYSFEELLDAIKHIIQLIFIVTPTFGSVNEETLHCQDSFKATNIHLDSSQNQVNDKNTNLFENNGLPRNNLLPFSPQITHLKEYLPLINASNLTLSINPSNKNNVTISKSKNISSEFNELKLEIISAILQYSVNDIVPNVRVRAFQTINSIVSLNELGSLRKTVFDQVKYSYENDTDIDVRTYCLFILKNELLV